MSGISNNPSNASESIHDIEYLYASIVNVSNFVSTKLSSDRNYFLWKTQMLCLMKSQNMGGIVDDSLVSPRTSSKETMDQYDSLLKGWIFGSASENVLGAVVHLASAKDVWDRLKSLYGVTMSHQQANTAPTNLVEETEAEEKAEAEMEIVIYPGSTRTETESEAAEKEAATNKKSQDTKNLHEAAMKGDWSAAESILKEDNDLVREAISSDGSMVLHIAVGIGHDDFVKNLFSYIYDEDVVATRNSDGSTALHIAAIVGNKFAADLLIKKNKNCLRMKDKNGQEPLHKAYEKMHLDTIGYLLKAVDEYGKIMSRFFSIGSAVQSHLHPGVEIGVDLLVNAISAKEYNLTSDLIDKFPKFASKSDDVLMAIAKTFPSGDYEKNEDLLSWKLFSESICQVADGMLL